MIVVHLFGCLFRNFVLALKSQEGEVIGLKGIFKALKTYC